MTLQEFKKKIWIAHHTYHVVSALFARKLFDRMVAAEAKLTEKDQEKKDLLEYAKLSEYWELASVVDSRERRKFFEKIKPIIHRDTIETSLSFVVNKT